MKEWYFLKEKEKVGPLTPEEIQSLIKSNEITLKTKVWKKGLKAWEDISKIDDFKAFFPTPSKITPKPEDSAPDGFPDDTVSDVSDSDKTYSMILCLVSVGFCCFAIPGLVMWFIKKDKSKFINNVGINVLNNHITMLIISIGTCGFGGIPCLLYSLVVLIMAGIKAKKGELWKIPGFNFIKNV